MPYLSRIWLNPLRTTTRAYLRNPQTTHAATLGGISTQPVDERILWRLEPDPRSQHRLQLIVLTQSCPSWEHIVEEAGWPGADEPQILVRPYEPVLAAVSLGREFAFRLRANTVGSTTTPAAPSPAQKERLATQTRPRSVRVPHRTAAHQLTWLTDRLARWGFTPVTGDDNNPAVRLAARERLTFRKNSGHEVVLQTGTFEGIIRVTDADAAHKTLLQGVGPAKAYGLGLLTLAPPVRRLET
jgi:CRISPR system Cascade subunit CasE